MPCWPRGMTHSAGGNGPHEVYPRWTILARPLGAALAPLTRGARRGRGGHGRCQVQLGRSGLGAYHQRADPQGRKDATEPRRVRPVVQQGLPLTGVVAVVESLVQEQLLTRQQAIIISSSCSVVRDLV